jgi:Peptidase family M48
MDWDAFVHRFGVNCWDSGQIKMLIALKRAAMEIPDTILCNLPPVRIFTPTRADCGVTLMVETTGQVFSPAQPLTLMYLSPLMELYSQAEIEFTVAHEFAHIALGHLWSRNAQSEMNTFKDATYGDAPSEIAADKLAESWGFSKE